MPTVKHLSYANVVLPLPSPQLERGWLMKRHPPYDFTDFDGFNFDQPPAPGVPTPPVPRPFDFRLNTLTWPTGASRPAWFHFVCDSDRLAAIKAAVGATALPAPLYLYDGRTGKTVTARMRMLPERPCNVTAIDEPGETFWIVTLTDDRYFWYLRRGTVGVPSTWTDLFSKLSALIGTAITVDTVDASYGTPSSKWATDYRTPGSLLDAAAYSVGQRVVVGLDGGVRTVNWETARTASNLYFSTADAPVSGGRVSNDGITRCAPESVNVVFGTTPPGAPHVVNKTLASLGVTGYGTATGLAGTSDTVFGDALYDGTNTVALSAYAAAAATDCYGWRLADPDCAWPGVEPWHPTGWEERIEWTMSLRDDGPFSLTTVRRGPWTEFYAGDYLHDVPTTTTLTVEEADGFPSVLDVTTIRFDQDDGFVVTEVSPGIARIDLTMPTPPPTYVGCGLTTDSGQIVFDYTTVAGDRADTGLVVRDNPDPDCDNLAFDDETFSTVVSNRDVYQSFGLTGGLLEICFDRYTDTDHYNRQGVITKTVTVGPVPVCDTVDPCLFAECCEASTAGPLTVTITYDTNAGASPLTVNFSSIVGNGVTPIAYAWDFGDGATSTDDSPSHIFTGFGYFEVSLTVTDSCGRTATNVVYVFLTSSDPCGCTFGSGMIPETYAFTMSGGTDDFAPANGAWTAYLIPFGAGVCGFYGSLNNWFVSISFVAPDYTMRADFVDVITGATMRFESASPQSTPCAVFPVSFVSSTGTGTPPTISGGGAVTNSPDPCPCPVTICPGTAFQRTLSSILYAKVSVGSAGDVTFPIVWDGASTYTGTSPTALCSRTFTVIAEPCYDGVDESWSVTLVGVNGLTNNPSSYSPFTWATGGGVPYATATSVCSGATGDCTVTLQAGP